MVSNPYFDPKFQNRNDIGLAKKAAILHWRRRVMAEQIAVKAALEAGLIQKPEPEPSDSDVFDMGWKAETLLFLSAVAAFVCFIVL